jgi:YVTN family beta-propeller protein
MYGFGLLMYDSLANLLFVGGGGLGVQEWNASTGAYVRTTPFLAPSAVALDPATGQVYAAEGSNVSVLNITSNKIVAAVAVGNSVVDVAYDPLNHSVAATNDGPAGFGGSAYVSFINDSNYSWFDTNLPNTVSGYGAAPTNVVYDPFNGTLVVSCENLQTFAIFNATDEKLTGEVGAGRAYSATYDPANGGFYVSIVGTSTNSLNILAGNFSVVRQVPNLFPGAVVYDARSNEMLLTDISAWAGGGVLVFNATTNNLTAIWNTSGPAPRGMAFGGPNDTLFLDGYGQRGLWALNSTSDAIEARLTSAYTAGPWAAVSDHGLVFTTEANNGSVECWNATSPYPWSSGAPVDPKFAGSPVPEGLALDPRRDLLLVADNGANALTVIHPLNLSQQATVGVGTAPTEVVYVPVLDEYFVADSGSNQVSVVNASTLTVVKNISVGGSPEGIAYDPLAGALLVTESAGSDLAVIPTSNLTARLVPTGANPWGVLVDISSDTVLIANSGSSNLTDLNATSLVHAGDTPVGAQPENLVVDPLNGTVVVSNYASDSLSFLHACLRPSCLGVGRFVVSLANVPLGSSTTFAVEIYSAVGNVTYSYSGLPNGCVSVDRPGFSCTPNLPGNFTVRVNVTDSTGTMVTASLELRVFIPSNLSIEGFTVIPSVGVVGQPIVLNASVLGGVPPYAFNFSGLPAGCVPEDQPEFTCRPTVAGNFSLGVVVTDSNSSVARATAQLTTTYGAPPVVNRVVSSPMEPVVNQTVTFMVEESGGWGWSTIAWTGLPGGCLSRNTSTLNCTPEVAGPFTIMVNSIDGIGRRASGALILRVLPPAPSVSGFVVEPNPGYVGSNLTVSVTVSGGESPVGLAYASLPPGCPATTKSTYTCVPSSAGTFNLTVIATDAAGRNGTATVMLHVIPQNSAGAPGPRAAGFLMTPIGLSILVGGVLVAGITAARALRGRRRGAPQEPERDLGPPDSALRSLPP